MSNRKMQQYDSHNLPQHSSRSRYPGKPGPRVFTCGGPAGSEKTFLLDAFFAALPVREKKRVHFHEFFQELHQRLFKHANSQHAMQNTLEEMLNDCKFLCLDEFHVHDIGDAMLISRMLKTIFERDCLLLTTSNYPPEGLLPNPLYHDRFLPTIQLIEAHMDIISLAGAIDYRSLGNFNANAFSQGAFLSLGNAQQRAQFSLPSPGQSLLQLTVNDRGLTVISAHSDTLQLSFSDICETTTATMDYLALVNIYSRWVIEDIPKISSTSEAAQQRFINLVNVLYDRRCEVFMTSPLSTSVTIDH